MIGVLDIRDSLISHWNQNYKSTPTLYSNQMVNLPDSLKQNPFVVFEIEFNRSRTVGVNGYMNGTRHQGFVAVTINVPSGTGNRKAYELADEVVKLLSTKRVGSIVFESAWIDNEEDRQEHFALIILAPFEATVG